MEEYLTIPKIAQQLSLSDNTVRRYTKKYPQFFKKKWVDGWEHFQADETIRLVQKINDISAAGKRRSKVVAELKKEFDEIYEPVEAEDEDEVNGFEFVEFGPESMAVLNRIAGALERLVENAG